MSDLLRLVRFELGYYLRRISTWVYFVLLTFLAYLMMITFAGAFPDVSASIGGTDGNVLVNSTHVLMILISTFGLFGILVVAAVAGNAGFRDFGVGMHPLVFTTPVPRRRYVASRYIGAVIVNTLVLSGIGVGMWLGSVMPFVEVDRLGPNTLAAYLQPYLVIVIPNTLFTTAIFVAMALLTRKRLPHFLGGAALLLGYMVAQVLMPDLETKWIATLADPFGITSVGVATEYWTTVEKNSQLIWFTGLILWNRLLWIGVSLAIVALAAWRFRFSHSATEGRRRKAAAVTPDELAIAAPPTRVEIPTARRSFGFGAMFLQLRSLTARGFREVIASPYFVAIILAGVLFLIMNSLQLETIYGTRTWPMAWKVIEILGGSFALFVVILVTLYAGELVWRERDLKLDQVVDATPTPSWVSYLSKLIALSVMVMVLLGVVMVAGMATQAMLGFFRFEPGLYFQKLVGMELPEYLLLCVLALAIHTLVNHKYTGHFILILFYLALDMLPFMGLEHSMWQYAGDLGDTYSDMNRHGWYLGPFIWFKFYWAGCAILMAVGSNLLWPRGVDGRIRSRYNSARLRVRATVIAAAVVGAVFALGAGGFLYYNTNVLNTYRDSNASETRLADYEKEYKQYEGLPQPRITDVSLEVDLYPEEGDVLARGTYRLINRTEEPIDTIHVLLDPDAGIRELRFGVPSEIDHENSDLGYRIFKLETPWNPGETSTLQFDLAYERDGFAHSVETAVVHNGSFVNSSILPSFGYDPSFELTLDRTRKKHDLEPKERMRDLDDPVGRNDNYISRDADWVNFEVIVSTSPDQIALAPGYIQREWEENGRRYFHYAMDAPILNFFSFLSARYETVSDRWNDVAIEVYYHPGHEFNLDRMIESVKKSLDYFTTEFSPYQHRQVRILEFPRYASFAQSFPNTIPYSESIGFIARLKEDDIDYPFYVTAHEIAHQWWAHQVIGANVQGSTVLSETLAQYSALMVMEREFGAHDIRRFLEYELDTYLRGRSTERKKEVPLLRVENQGYIHYRKGSLIMYALKDAIGEEAVNRALAGFLDRWAFQGPPYPTSRDLVEAFRAETPEDLQPWLDDLFEHITLYENRAIEATSRETDDGSYEVTLTFEARKLRAGEQGEETEVALNDPVDIGVFDDDGNPLYFESHRLDGTTSEVTVIVDGVPARAGIDPYRKLIDRHPDDNEISVD
jgi:ABC-type transport system involved in multi-copper enzyme maturation permease subunit